MGKESTKQAIANWYARVDAKNKPKPVTRKNEAPEKLVEKEIRQWLSSQNIFHKIVESKAVLSSQYGGYRKGQADAGFPDLVGCLASGHFLAIELKALGRRSNLSGHQREFLLNVISNNGFACVSDSVSHVSYLLFSWQSLASVEARRELLLSDLPKQRAVKIDNSPLFDAD